MRTTLPRLGLLAATLISASCGDDAGTLIEGERVVPDAVVFDIPDTAEPGGGLPADFATPCDENADCLSGFCVEGPDGSVCTTVCVEECPDGWLCRGVQTGSSDIAFVCVPGAPGPGPDTVGGEPDADGGETPTPTEPTGDLCDPALDVDSETILLEPAGGDFPDCIVGCGRPAETAPLAVDMALDPYTAVRGVIDGGQHLYDGLPGPDIDVVTISAPARTMLELAVVRADASSRIDPVIFVHDGFGIRTFNRDVSTLNDCARTTIAFPWLRDLRLYVFIEDSVNADAWSPEGYAPGGWVGGEDYRWLMRMRQRPFTPVELGTLSGPGALVQLDGQRLETGGITRYYRFHAPGLADVSVSLRKLGGASLRFVPMLAGMKTMLGALEWQRMLRDAEGTGQIHLNRAAFRPCVPPAECFEGNCNGPVCTEAPVEYIFAVGDWAGAGGDGFTYQLVIAHH